METERKGEKLITFGELKSINRKAYDRCVEALIDDYHDEFVIRKDGTLLAYEEADLYGTLGEYPQVWRDGDWEHYDVDEEENDEEV